MDEVKGDLRVNSKDDFQRVNFYDNLAQAIRIRLMTAQGSLAMHPQYGSKLYQLLGTNPTDQTLILAKMHVKDALLQEPRVDSILKLTARFRDVLKNVIDIELQVQPIKSLEPLDMVYSVFV